MSGHCFYRKNSPGLNETQPRLKPFDLEQSPCEGIKRAVSYFISQMTAKVDLRGCNSVLDLLNVRANGEAVDDSNEESLNSRIICDGHFRSLVMEWETTTSKLRSRKSGHSMAVECPLFHKKQVDADPYRVVNKDYNACDALMDPHSSCDEMDDHDDSGVGDAHSPQPSTQVQRSLPKEAIDSMSQFVKILGGDRMLTREKWDTLSPEAQRKKVYLARRIFSAACHIISPDGQDELYARAIAQTRNHEDEQLADLLFARIDERFGEASSSQEKIELLSLITDLGLTQQEMIRCVPSASLYYINQAKIFNKGGLDFDKEYRREAYNAQKTERYIEYLARSNALVSLPWGDTLAKLSDGSTTPIASLARKFSFSRIHRMYLRDLEATNEMHLKLGRGSTTRILKVLAKRKNERLACVDEFFVDAYTAWSQLTTVVEELRMIHGLIGDGDERALKRWIRISRSHLEGEFMSEVCESSNVPQHCAQFALSDSRCKCFAVECNHDHDGECSNCDQLDMLLANLASTTDRLAKEASESNSTKLHRIRRLHEIVVFSCLQIRSYQAHLVRTALSNNGRAQIQEDLKDGEALLTLDFGMKILPLKSIEGQSNFFGKKGITLHIVHALAKIDGKLVDHVFAHTLDDVTQDSKLVYSIIKHTLAILEAKGINTVTIRSDNAGAYKCSALISSLFHLSSPKMRITGYHFSESQSGKGPCDRACSHCKRKMNEWTTATNNIINARNIFEALTVRDETVRGLSTYLCTFSAKKTKSVNAFPGIQQLFSFEFEADGVRSRGQYGIGEGRLTKKASLPVLDCRLEVVEEGGHLDGSFWSSLDSSEKEKKTMDEEEEQINDSDMFHCSTPGCTKSYQTTRWLIEHEIRGDHRFLAKKESMTDRAVSKFNELIETREAARIAVTEQVESTDDEGERYEHGQGWALKSSHTTHGLDKTAKEHAEKYFNDQRDFIPPRRAEAAFMRKQLEDAMDPSDATGSRYLLAYEKIPSEKQLTSLFSRLERKRAPKTPMTAVKIPKTSKAAPKTSKKKTRTSSSVRSTSEGTRKRKVVKESEESELDDDVFEEEVEVEDESIEILREHEDDFINRVIEEEIDEIYL